MANPAPNLVQAQAYDADGNPIAPDQVAASVAAGKGFFQKDARVYARNPRGEVVTIAPEDAASPGYQLLSQSELQQAANQKKYGEGVGNVAKAGVAGAARGLTLGASDAVATALGGEETRTALEGLRSANPIASGVGEVAGAVAPLVLSGGSSAGAQGASLAGRAGQLGAGAVRTLGAGHRAIAGVGGVVERGVARGLAALGADGATVAGRIGASAVKLGARGAAEGALYGAATAANDAVLQGDDITAEKIVAGMGHGALFGGALGAGLGGVGKAVGEGAARLIPKKEALQQLAREQALKSVARGTDIRRIAGRAVGDAAEARLNATADDLLGYTFQTGAAKGERVFIPGANAEELLTRISAAKNEAGARLGGLKDELSEQMAAAGAAPDVGEFLRRVKEQVTDPLLKSNVPGVRANVRAVDRQLSIVKGNYEAALQSGNPDQMAMSFRQLDDLRGELRSVFQPKAPPTGGMPPPAPKSAQYLEKTERILADYLKEHASGFLAKIGDDPNAYNELNRQFSSFSKLEQITGKNVNQSLGNRSISPSDHALGLASFLGASATGNVGALGSMALGGAGAFANKLLRERGNSLVADLARRASETDNVIKSAASALAGAGEKVKAPALTTAFEGEGLREQYERAAVRVRELAQPAIAQQHVSSLIPEVAAQHPNVGAAVSRKLLAIYQQLSAKLPASRVDTGSTLTPMAVKERVPPAAMRQFMSEVKGTLEPERVISELGRGIIDRDAIAALKTSHPQMFQQLRTQVADMVQERHDELPYKRRVLLSMTFDFVGDSALSPARMAGLQQAAQSLSAQESAQNAAMVKPSRPGNSKAGESMRSAHDSTFSGDM